MTCRPTSPTSSYRKLERLRQQQSRSEEVKQRLEAPESVSVPDQFAGATSVQEAAIELETLSQPDTLEHRDAHRSNEERHEREMPRGAVEPVLPEIPQPAASEGSVALQQESLSGASVHPADAGRVAEEEVRLLESLAEHERDLGPSHPSVAASLNSLALLRISQGRHAEAVSWLERALWIWVNAVGPEHPEVAVCLNNLATVCYAEERYAEAEALLLRSLAIKEKALLPEHRSLATHHPDLAADFHNLAVLYEAQGKFAEAEPLFQRTLKTLEESLAPEDTRVATCLENYATLLRKTSQELQAAELESRANAIRARERASAGKKENGGERDGVHDVRKRKRQD